VTIEMFDGTVRLALGATAFLALVVAFGLWRRGVRTPVTLLMCLAFACAG
jgi:hypothetical protein